MIYLLDTNAITDLVREDPVATSRLMSLKGGDSLATCVIVSGEILFGLRRLPVGKRRNNLERKARSILTGLVCLAVPEAAAEHYATIKHDAQLEGKPLDTNDLWIAATAMALDATLVTRDRDFTSARNLRTENWSV